MKKTPLTLFQRRFDRRQFIGTSLAAMTAAVAAGLPTISVAGAKTLTLGMNIPMTGD